MNINIDPREKDDPQPVPAPNPEPVVLPQEPYNPNSDLMEKSGVNTSESFPKYPLESDS